MILLPVAAGLAWWVSRPVTDDAAGSVSAPVGSGPLAVVLHAASEETIRFKAQNGRNAGGDLPQAQALPHLVLTRNRTLTEARERTLFVEVNGMEVPPAGITLTLSVETQHADPDVDAASPPRIEVWHEVQYIVNETGITETAALVLSHEFTSTFLSGTKVITTPTDYFRYDLVVGEALRPESQPKRISRDHAFLIERQEVVSLPGVREAWPGAAPHALIVYYCDMFPFRRDRRDPVTWVAREAVPRYIHAELIPAMVEAYRVQSDVWGLPWYDAWTSYRSGRDTERLSVALTDGETWYHGVAPSQGHAGISINVSRSRVEYETLTDALISTFHHELFHNHQHNISRHWGGQDRDLSAEPELELFTEGTAVLASSVGLPEVHFEQSWGLRAYALHARGFVGSDGISQGDLNRSYGRLSGYHAAAYWRFLYEACGGMTDGTEDPAAGMAVIGSVLRTLYTYEVTDPAASADPVSLMPRVMDRALSRAQCPFKTYRESLEAFARAIYALHVAGGRCRSPGLPVGCGFYDPHGVYAQPPHSTLLYTGAGTVYTAAGQPYPAGIPSSFGMDFVDVVLDPRTDRSPFAMAFHVAPGTASEFTVQVWHLLDLGDGAGLHVSAAPANLPVSITVSAGRDLVYHIPALDMAEFNRIGLLITRVDSAERLDPNGAYTIMIGPELRSRPTGDAYS